MRMQATLIAASLATPDPAFSATPQPDKGDTASMLLSSTLVLLMSVPALDLSYGGLGRAKNMLLVLMQVFVVFLLVCVLWFVYGYSIALAEGNPFFGGFGRLLLVGIGDPATGEWALASTFAKGARMCEIVFVVFHATFAAIASYLILGSMTERIRFPPCWCWWGSGWGRDWFKALVERRRRARRVWHSRTFGGISGAL